MATSASTVSTIGLRHLALLWAGVGLLLVSTVLYVSGTSHAVGLWMLPAALSAVGIGWAGHSGRHVPRWCYVVLAVVVLALALLGTASLVFNLTHPPMAV